VSSNSKSNLVLAQLYALAYVLVAPIESRITKQFVTYSDAFKQWNSSVSDFNVTFGNVQVSGGLLIETAVLIPVSVLVAALLIPPAFSQVFGATTAGWNSAVITIFQILFPALAVLAIAFQYVRELTRGV
jgi:hypothetical protein